jgi:predicted short-subunit dehydrogenase-like oxidoreductase (DUF2520 family)
MSVRIFIIGAGRVGSSLGKALNSEDFCITHIYHHTKTNAHTLNIHFPKTKHWYKFDRKAIEECDVVLITVPDDSIEAVVHRLSTLSESWNNKICIHTSGLLSSEILNPLRAKGAAIASLHPMQSINTLVANPTIFHDVILTFEGSETAKDFCRSAAKKITAQFREISTEQKLQYHIGGTIAANLLVGLIDIVAKLFSESGFKDSEKLQMINQLSTSVLKNYSKGNFAESLTGPIQRGDVQTIKQHLDYISKKHPELFQIYCGLSRYILDNFTEHSKDLHQKLAELLQ